MAERRVFQAAVLCFALAFAGKHLAGAFYPELRVSDVLHAQEALIGELPGPDRGLDPWGKPWGSYRDGCCGGGPYSVGPNGENEFGAGDDMHAAVDPRGYVPGWLWAYWWSRELLVLVGLWTCLSAWAIRRLRPRHGHLLGEVVARTTLAWLPLALPCALFALALEPWLGERLGSLPALLVPPRIALALTTSALSFGLLLWTFARASAAPRPTRPAPPPWGRLALFAIAAELLLVLISAAELASACSPHGLASRHLDTGASGLSVDRTFQLNCAACHSLDGTRGVGRSVKGLYGTYVEQRDGIWVFADDAFIRRSILDPGYELTKGFDNQMAAQDFANKLSEEQVERLVEFYRNPEGATQGTYDEPR